MQISLWMGGMIISFNLLEMQFLIIIRYVPLLTLIPIQPYFIYYLNQRYAEPSDLEEYIRVNNLS